MNNAQFKRAADAAFGNLEAATTKAREFTNEPVPDDVQYIRYRELVQQPSKLYDFVAKSLNTRDPASVQEGAAQYLEEMRKRYGDA